jgi:hypothetical protein
MAEKKKSGRLAGLLISGFFTLSFGVALIGSISAEKSSGDPLVVLLVIFVLFALWFRSCYTGRKKYFADEKKKKQELMQRTMVERQVMNDSKSDHFECTYLGGSGYQLVQDEKLFLALAEDCLRLTRISDRVKFDIPFSNIHGIEVSGPGTVTTNAGVSGGGFGLEGFLKGAVAAAVINAATTKTSTNTFTRILSVEGEIYLHTSTKDR